MLDQQGQRLWRNLTGSSKPIDRNTAAMQLMNMGRTTEQTIGENLRDRYGGWAENAYYTVQNGMRSGMNTFLSGGNPWVRAALDSGSVGAQVMADGYDKGYSDNKALNNSLLAVGGNYLMQAPVDQRILNGFSGQGIKGALKSGGLQAAKEVSAAAVQTVADTLINGEESSFAVAKQAYLLQGNSEEDANWLATKDVLQYMGGALTSGLLEGAVEFGTNELMRKFDELHDVWRDRGKQIREAGKVEEVYQQAQNSPADSEAYRTVNNKKTVWQSKIQTVVEKLEKAADSIISSGRSEEELMKDPELRQVLTYGYNLLRAEKAGLKDGAFLDDVTLGKAQMELMQNRLTRSNQNVINQYIPRDENGNVIALKKQNVNGQDIPLPDPMADGPHTVLGGKTSSKTGGIYRQTATFPEGTWPTINGKNVPWSEVHWTNHGRADHSNPHQHVFVYVPEKGGWVRKRQKPYLWRK